MPKVKIYEETVKYEGIFNMEEFYKLFVKYFKDKGYDIIHPIAIVNAKELKQNGITITIFELKLNDYYKISLKTTILYFDVEEIKVKNTINNEEIKLNQGKISVKFEGFIDFDYDSKFSSFGPIGEIIRTLTENKFLKDSTKTAKEILQKHIQGAKEMIERYFNINAIKKKLI